MKNKKCLLFFFLFLKISRGAISAEGEKKRGAVERESEGLKGIQGEKKKKGEREMKEIER